MAGLTAAVGGPTAEAIRRTVVGATNILSEVSVPTSKAASTAEQKLAQLIADETGSFDPNKLFNVVPYGSKSSPLENHHGILDAWAKNNIPGYKVRPPNSPTITLTKSQHDATKAVYRQWLFERTGRQVGAKVDWNNVSPKEIYRLSERMFEAAGVPHNARDQYYEAFFGYIKQLQKED